MRKPIEIFCEMSTLASHMSDCRRRGNTECLADDAQEMDRLRGEHCRSRGVAEQDISADGYNISQGAYERSRDRWIEEITAPGASDWFLDGAREAYDRWIILRPDLTAQDSSWFARVPASTEV